MDSFIKIYTDCLVYDTDIRSFIKASVVVDGERIADVVKDGDALPEGEVISLGGKYVIPGLVDVHSHGRGGFDFNTASPEDYEKIALSYAKAGTTSVMPTLASDTLDSLEASVKAIAEYENTPGYAAFAGVHLEGRYLSHTKRGAHPEWLLSSPSCDEIKRFKTLAEDTRMRLSIAPEIEGSDDMIHAALELGVTVSAAHTDANYEQLIHAVDEGVTGFTHTFNCMRPIHHRDPGGAGAALLCDRAYAEFICDGMHIAPEMILLSHKVKDPDKLVLITDSMEAAGCPDGEYSIAGLPVFVKDGKAVNIEGTLAGSTLDMFTGMVNYMKFCSIPLEEALPKATINPAKMICADGELGSIAAGKRADLIIISDPENPAIDTVIAGGLKVE
ncbi:MAG: N-acetylglucosamine-6-phosphate deacetylase [Clostridia bacterium]|nr:N-acetylglucosamine-6-phosphate deacetylase [Clostridia bacterium]